MKRTITTGLFAVVLSGMFASTGDILQDKGIELQADITNLSMNAENTADGSFPQTPEGNPVKMGGIMRKEASASQQASTKSEEETFIVTCTTPTHEDWRPLSVFAYTDGHRRFEVDMSGTVRLPAGTYDFIASFDHISSASYYGTDYRGLVIKEGITISSDTTIDFDPALSTERIHFQPMLEGGQSLRFRNVSYDNSWNESILDEGNFPITMITVAYSVGTAEWESQFSVVSDGAVMETPYGITSPEWYLDLYVNKVSERINFGFTCILTGDKEKNDGTYVMSADQKGSVTGTISNNPLSWTDMTLDGAWTPKGAETLDLIHQYGLGGLDPYGLRFLISGGDILNSGSCSSFGYTGSQHIHFSNDAGSDAYVHVLIAPTMTEVYKDGIEFKGITNIGNYIWFKGNGAEDVTCVPIHYLPYSCSNMKPINIGLPGCGAFTAEARDNHEVDFATSPALFSIIYDQFWPQGNSYYSLFNLDYIGRLGESRYTDRVFVGCKATVNGVDVASDYDGLNDWLDKNSDDLTGKLEISLTNDNCVIEGRDAGNHALVTVDLDNDDIYPPSLTMLQFRNDKEEITSRFNKGEIRLSASDINFSRTDGIWQVESPAYVKCEYAPSGTDAFKELELTQDFWYEEILGTNFRAQLSSESGSLGWYDVRITVADAAGNSQIQTIKMAFELDLSNSVPKTEYVTGNVPVEYYRIDGVKVSSEFLYPGIYMVRYADGTVRKVMIGL